MNNKNKMMRCVSSSDLIDAKLEEHQLCGSKQCPGCGHTFQPTTNPEWVGLPAGVKFDPTDQELIQHLEAKVESKTINNNNKSHPLIDEFIPTIEGDDGICYTHPDKLPGVRRDGLSRHFFHRPSKAYTTGTRKRRKIQNDECELQGETRWHKTGKTRPVMVGGKQRGCKKILVLYTNFGKNRKPEKTNWVMHQYHVGLHEEEKEGELVVSKIFYQTQPRQCSNYWPSSLENTTTAAAPQELINNNNGISSTRNNNSNSNSNDAISSSSSKEMLVTVTQSQRDDSRDEMCSFTTASLSDHFGFIPFRKPAFHDQVGVGEGSTAREEVEASAAAGGSCEQQVHHHHHQHNATTAFHMSRPSHPIISPPPLHHTTSIILDDHNDSSSYHLPTIMLQNHHHFQQQHHRKLGGGRSASGLEEIIMGCTSTHDHIKEASSSMTNAEEGEWLKYSSYWPDPAHHG